MVLVCRHSCDATPLRGLFGRAALRYFQRKRIQKNFFKASLLIDILGMLLIILFTLLGLSPVLLDLAKQAVDHLPKFFKGN